MVSTPQLYASRLVKRFVHDGFPYLGSLLAPRSLPLTPPTEALFSALWDRADHRPLEQRLARPGVPEDPAYRRLLLDRMRQDSLLIEEGFDEEAAWIALQRKGLQRAPHVDQVELTNACPFPCAFCPRGRGEMTRPVGHMSLELLRRIAGQVRDLDFRKPFGLHHFGDPILHPDAAGAVRVVVEAGLQAEISVNPILLTPEKAQALLEAGVGVLILSMDGLDDETLSKSRGRRAGPVEKVFAHVEAALELAARMEKPPTVMLSMVATVHNRHQWLELFERYSRPDRPWQVPVVRLLEDFGDPGIAPLGVRRLRQLCGSPWNSVSILWDGTVVPCCHDFDGRIRLGDASKQSLEEIWRSEPMEEFRRRFIAHQFQESEPCARCRWRPDLYIAAGEVADGDAWTPALWPEKLPRE